MSGNNFGGIIIQDRDRHLLREIAGMRIIDREQAMVVATFNSIRRANCRLLALTRTGILRRFFWGTIAGGRKAIYSLAPKATSVIDVPIRTFQRKPNQTLVGDLFVAHQLDVNDVFIAVKYRSIPMAGASFCRWLNFTKPLSADTRLIPDGYFELNSLSGIRPAFLEIDRGTEPQSTWQRKIQAYVQFAVSGQFSAVFHQNQFRVLVVANSERRLNFIRRTASRITDKIFWFSTLHNINRDGLWAPVWLRSKGEQWQSLI